MRGEPIFSAHVGVAVVLAIQRLRTKGITKKGRKSVMVSYESETMMSRSQCMEKVAHKVCKGGLYSFVSCILGSEGSKLYLFGSMRFFEVRMRMDNMLSSMRG